MRQFKYILDKSTKKFTCPICNKKTFVKYIETETGDYLHDEFGRCDRETNCGYHRKPETEFKQTFKAVEMPKPIPSFHSLDLVEKTVLCENQNNFIQFMKTLFAEDKVNEAISDYLIGTWDTWKGTTVFWQIDHLEKVCHGKVMMYDPITGKRSKREDGRGIFSTVRSLLKLDNFNINQCLFGLHLVNENTKIIGLVEAEKTAFIMRLFKPEYTWLATGSKGGFKYEFLKPIKHCKIVAFPDKSEYNDWLNKATDLNRFGFSIMVSDWLENSDYEDGTDLADVYINESKQDKGQAKNNLNDEVEPMRDCQFSKGSLEVGRTVQARRNKGAAITREESQEFLGTMD